jgi:antirestriction protein ArdC
MKADDLYDKVTNGIIEAIESGAADGRWEMPWIKLGSGLPMRLAGKPYRGINLWILSATAEEKGYRSAQWGTFKGWLGERTEEHPDVCVRKGEKGTEVFLWQPGTKPSRKRLAENPDAKSFLLTKVFHVFNRDQVDGLPPEPDAELPEHERTEHAEAYFDAIGADVRIGGDRAFYASVQDYIGIPELEQFSAPEHYYSTLAHEHVHWTGHEDRLNRDLHNRFGSEAYAAEELIAEIGAAFWCVQMGIAQAPRLDHSQYVKHWLTILRGDRKAIITAAARASDALEHLNTAAAWQPDNALEAV